MRHSLPRAPVSTRTAGAASRRIAILALPALVALVASPRADAQQSAAPVSLEALTTALAAVRASNPGVTLPAAAAFSFGDATVATHTVRPGPVAVANGAVHVRGTVDGDVVAYDGEILVHEGGDIRGDAIAIQGKVTFDGGRVGGEARSLSGDLTTGASAGGRARTATGAVASELALAGGWIAVLMIVGIGVLVFASSNLGAVAETVERDFVRALLAGIAAQLALLPVLVLLVVGLALTLLGILLIPFAVVAYVLAVAGLVTLGYLAIANLTGRAFVRASNTDETARRTAALMGVVLGLIVLMVPWFIAAGLAWSSAGGLVARTVAIAVTWVACSAGLGGALISRGGVRRSVAPTAQRAMAAASWQTPTPVAGVTAARRPTPLATPVRK